MNNKVAVYDTEIVDKHIPISRLPETPERTICIRTALRKFIGNQVDWLEPDAASLQFCQMVHTKEYLAYLDKLFDTVDKSGKIARVCDDDDVVISHGSRAAVQATIAIMHQAAEKIVANEYKRIFCNVRPPGHHACAGKAMGFCLINNIAVLTNFLLMSGDPTIKKIAIVDWDVHHGNGTHDLFYNIPNVMYMSLHEDYTRYYPGTGKPEETGEYDNVRNYNMKTGAGHNDVVHIFQNELIPKLKKFAPNIILISCGFDAHHLDPIGMLNYQTETYTFMTQQLMNVAQEYCEGRIISVLEGGYNPNALADAAVAHISALIL